MQDIDLDQYKQKGIREGLMPDRLDRLASAIKTHQKYLKEQAKHREATLDKHRSASSHAKTGRFYDAKAANEAYLMGLIESINQRGL